MKKHRVDICIIGAGAAGLSVAAVASQLNLDVVLVENHKMGGDCLNYGCVPSKALLAAGKARFLTQNNSRYGIEDTTAKVDYAKVKAHVKRVIAAIAPNDSQERFEKLGATIINNSGHFINKKTFQVAGQQIQAKRFIIATGSSPAIPPIPGLDKINYLTNETIFDLEQQPEHLVVIGAGPIGCEMAQAHHMLGTKVTILEAFTMMPRDDQDCVAILKKQFKSQGIDLYEKVKISKVEKLGNNIEINIKTDDGQQTLTASHLLVATGRKANIEGLHCQKAKIDTVERGIKVNNRLQTSNKKIYAIGDVAGGYQFTHIASYHASIVIKNIIFRLPSKVNYRAVPWVTYTLPELSHVGMSEEDAKKQDAKMRTLQWSFNDNDRAQAEHETDGLAKVFVDRKGYILGVSMITAHAGELISPWIIAMEKKLKITDMANLIIPYPTFSEVNKRIAGSYFTDMLFSKRTKWIVKWLNKLIP